MLHQINSSFTYTITGEGAAEDKVAKRAGLVPRRWCVPGLQQPPGPRMTSGGPLHTHAQRSKVLLENAENDTPHKERVIRVQEVIITGGYKTGTIQTNEAESGLAGRWIVA